VQLCTAPEVLRETLNIDYKQVDIYQLGMLIYHVLYKDEPLTNLPVPAGGAFFCVKSTN